MLGTRLVLGVLMALLSAGQAHSESERSWSEQRTAHWSYSGEAGPDTWAKLSPQYRLCGSGGLQSPIELSQYELSTPSEASFQYTAETLRIARHGHVADVLNNGHTVQIDVREDSYLMIGNTRYQLLQVHFHAPSEHAIAGQRFPMEMHLLHRSPAGELAVVGVLIRKGAQNPAFEEIWARLPAKVGDRAHHEDATVDPSDLIPREHRWYRYTGSLTTPPCWEGVLWLVLTDPIELSEQQIASFTRLYDGNNRTIQPRNGRPVVVEHFD